MRKVYEYQNFAEDCGRRVAKATKDEERKALERLAGTWDMLAMTRQMQIAKGLLQPIGTPWLSAISSTRLSVCSPHLCSAR
jgi:hypothetical protein